MVESSVDINPPNSAHPEVVDFGFWSRRTARDIIPLDGISPLISKRNGVQQSAADGRPQA
jgi:hypothetical protein